MIQRIILFIALNILILKGLSGQTIEDSLPKTRFDSFFSPAKEYNPKRFYGSLAVGATAYGGAMLWLDKVWYAQYPRGSFRFFDDNGEWEQMDKGGHVLTAYVETLMSYEAYRWAGVERKRAAWLGMLTGTVLQGSIEVLDGFSAGWGFSLGDFAANSFGCALFGLQEAGWGEQRILLKVSNFPKKYSSAITEPSLEPRYQSMKNMTDDLFGSTYAETFFKDYNAANWWLSVNPRSFAKKSKFPSWLNIALGYSVENVFGAYGNYQPAQNLTRYRQYFLSLDIDLSKIKSKNRLVRTLCRTFNFIKIPAPALEYNSLGEFKFHPFMF